MNFSKSVFWDVKVSDLDEKNHAQFIIARIVQRGLMQDWMQLQKTYTSKKIKSEIVKIPFLDKKTFNFLSVFYKIPKDNFRCYTKAQLHSQHWYS
ncbi:MAG: hypothetical protein H8E84_01360 [Flavobacteriales bacterium]|nr:hypothetical protein [Flavobacteriales bacterium]